MCLAEQSDSAAAHPELSSKVVCVQQVLIVCVCPAEQSDSTAVHPELTDMVAYVQARHAAIRQAASTARGTLDMTKPLPLTPKAYLALIKFLRQCRQRSAETSTQLSQDYLGRCCSNPASARHTIEVHIAQLLHLQGAQFR